MKFSMFESWWNKHSGNWAPGSTGNCYELSWTEFIASLEDSASKQWSAKTKEQNTNAPLISPAFYPLESCHRSNDEVSGWDSLFLDVDENGAERFETLLNKFEQHKLNYVLYSSPRCSTQELKFRAIVPMDISAMAAEIDSVKSAWDEFTGHIGDESCKDASRAYYVPGIYPNAEQFIISKSDGEQLSVEWLLENYYREPSQPKVTVHSTITPTSVTSANYYTMQSIINYLRGMKENDRYRGFLKIGGIIQHNTFNGNDVDFIIEEYRKYDSDTTRQLNIQQLLRRR
jgi:hypothetical protein